MTQEKTKSGYDFWFHKAGDVCLIHLHGLKEYSSMESALLYGPGQYIDQGWNPSFSIVIPRNASGENYFSTQQIEETIETVVSKFGVNADRLTMSGYSNGGGSAMNYCDDLQKYRMNLLILTAPYIRSGYTPKYQNLTMPIRLFCAQNDSLFNSNKQIATSLTGICGDLYYQWETGGGHTGMPKYVYAPQDYKGVYADLIEICNNINVDINLQPIKQWYFKGDDGVLRPTGRMQEDLFAYKI